MCMSVGGAGMGGREVGQGHSRSLNERQGLMSMVRYLTEQIDFATAYTQAPPEFDMYTRLPHGIECMISGKEHVLKLLKNLYRYKQGGNVWTDYLKKGLKEI
eukprot:9044047-Ditylum_brightwellii.AAC.1